MDESFVGVDLPGRATRSFDPQFTADMSRRMQVPERIALSESTGRVQVAPQQETHQLAASMIVPEKILIESQPDPFASSTFTASDEYENYDEPAQEERPPSGSGFETPPHRVVVPSGSAPQTQRGGSASGATQRELSYSEKTEQQQLDTLRKQVVSLSRRVAALESNAQRRTKVDNVLYPLVVLYLLVRVGGWLRGNSNKY